MTHYANEVNESAREIIASTEANTTPARRKNFSFRSAATLIAALNERAAVVTYGGNVGVLLLDRPLDPPLSFSGGANLFANWWLGSGEDAKKGFDVWKGSANRREFEGIEFQPDLSRADPRKFNRFGGFAVRPVEGDCSLIRAHILNVICSGDQALADYVEKWCADLIQNPGRKCKVALIMRGGKQIGKSYLSDYLADLVGAQHAPVYDDPSLLTAKHNSDLETALLLRVEEGFWAGNKSDEGRLKNLISGKGLRIEAKYENGGTRDSYCRLILTANEDHVVPVSGQDVRYCVIEVSPAKHGDTAYWQALSDERDNGGRAAFMHYLQNIDLDGWEAQAVPLTDALADQARLSLSPTESWWASFLESGELPSLDSESGGVEWELTAEQDLGGTVRPFEIERSRLFESYRLFAPGFRAPPTPAALGRFIAKHCPSAEYAKIPSPYARGGRANGYRMPPRQEAIAEFLAVHPRLTLKPLAQVELEDNAPATAQRSPAQASADVVRPARWRAAP